MVKPNILVLTGYGINCEEETKFAFDKVGGNAEIVHINDLSSKGEEHQILALPGGFSYGDDTGAGNALANRIKNNFRDEIYNFAGKDKLVIGICNGFQVLANLGLLPAIDGKYGEAKIALINNETPRYLDRWVDLEFEGKSHWTKGLDKMSLPIAHAEGNFYADANTLDKINKRNLVVARYSNGDICKDQSLVANPNGSLENIAAISDETGRIIGMMPHPERAIDFTQLPNWTLLKEQYKRRGEKIPEEGPGLEIFRNGIRYFE